MDRKRGAQLRVYHSGPLTFPVVLVAGLLLALIQRTPYAGDVQTDTGANRQAVPSSQSPAAVMADDEDPSLRRKRFAERLSRVKQALAEQGGKSPANQSSKELLEERKLLEVLDPILAQQQAVMERLGQVQRQEESIREQLADFRNLGLAEKPPYSFLQLEELLDLLAAERSRRDSLQVELVAARQLLQSLRGTYADAEARRRNAKEDLEANSNPAASSALARRMDLAQLYGQVSAEAIRLRRLQSELIEARIALTELQIEFLSEKAAVLRDAAAFNAKDLEFLLGKVAREEERLGERIVVLQGDLRQAEHTWEEAKRSASGKAEVDRSVTEEMLAARQAVQEAIQQQIELLSQRQAHCVLERFTWERRYQVANGQASDEELRDWHKSSREFLERLTQFRNMVEVRSAELRGELSAIEQRVDDSPALHPELLKWLTLESEQTHELLDAYGEILVRLTASRRLQERTLAEIGTLIAPASAEQWIRTAMAGLRTAWGYELAVVDDRPLTVAKIIYGLTLLGLGYLGSRWLSRFLGRRFLPGIGLGGGASSAFESIAFYTMLALFGFVSLELVNVPLTAFTFLGGAVAIGVGFGSQNILSNFISGLILLAERPVRAGDLIEIEGLQGTIDHVGARATRVRTGSNLEIIVPNSRFLENPVTNWTLSDSLIRLQVNVGVAYGSPTRETIRLLETAVRDNPKVLSRPEPIVIFRDFGDNALAFEVHFWVQIKTIMQGETIKSEVRLAIDDLLRDAGITVAFPQRDIHLDTSRPLEVNLLGLPALQHQDGFALREVA